MGFKLLNTNTSIFYKKGVIIIIYVNNLLITNYKYTKINIIKVSLNKYF
jgi:hypothetical protein